MAKKNKEDQNKEKINAKEENHVEAKAGDSKQDDFLAVKQIKMNSTT